MPEFPGTLKVPRLATAPGSPSNGQVYYDTVANELRYWNGTVWVGMNFDYSGDYVTPHTYNNGDIVWYGGSAYLCVKDGTTTAPVPW